MEPTQPKNYTLYPIPYTLKPKAFAFGFLIIGLIGFADATFLTIKHFTEGPVPCLLFTGCDVITKSKFSSIFGIPVALLGAIYYFIIFILGIAYLDMKKEKILRIISIGTIAGFLASLWFVSLQLFILKAICTYCMVSAGTSTLLFVIGMIYLQKSKTYNLTPIP